MSCRTATHYFPGTGSALRSFAQAYTSATTTRIGPFSANVTQARFLVTTDAFIKFGSSTVSGTSSSGVRLVASLPEYFTVKPGQYCAITRVSAGGTAYVNEMSQ